MCFSRRRHDLYTLSTHIMKISGWSHITVFSPSHEQYTLKIPPKAKKCVGIWLNLQTVICNFSILLYSYWGWLHTRNLNTKTPLRRLKILMSVNKKMELTVLKYTSVDFTRDLFKGSQLFDDII